MQATFMISRLSNAMTRFGCSQAEREEPGEKGYSYLLLALGVGTASY